MESILILKNMASWKQHASIWCKAQTIWSPIPQLHLVTWMTKKGRHMEAGDSACIAKFAVWIQKDKYFWNKEQIELQFDKNI